MKCPLADRGAVDRHEWTHLPLQGIVFVNCNLCLGKRVMLRDFKVFLECRSAPFGIPIVVHHRSQGPSFGSFTSYGTSLNPTESTVNVHLFSRVAAMPANHTVPI